MNDKTYELIEKLAVKMGTTGEYLWEVLIKQAYINSIGLSILYSIVFIILVFLIKFLIRIYKIEIKESKNSNEELMITFYTFIIIFVTAFFLFMSIMSDGHGLRTIIAGFINPEYWALKEVLGALK